MMASIFLRSFSASAKLMAPFSFAEPRDHAENRFHGTELLHLFQLLTEIFEGKLVFSELALEFHGLLLIKHLLGLSPRERTTSPMPSIRDASLSGKKGSRASSFSPVPMNLIGLPVTRLDGDSGAASRVAVKFGEDDAVDTELFIEGAGNAYRVLAGHCIEDKERLTGIEKFLLRDDLIHHLIVNVKPSGRINDERIKAVLHCVGFGLFADGKGVFHIRHGKGGHVDLLADLHKLVDCGGPVDVRRHK